MIPRTLFLKCAVACIALALFLFSGCQDRGQMPVDAPPDSPSLDIPQDVQDEIAELRQLASLPDHGVSKILNDDNLDSPPIVVPAGSVDALQAAIIAAGNNGKVILRSGLHTENSTVTVTTRGVRIVGENGAIIKCGAPTALVPPFVVNPTIHVLGVEKVNIWNIDFSPINPIGGTAILLENAPRSSVGCNTFTGFQWSVLLQNSHRSNIINNEVNTTLGWSTGDVPDAEGIININGNDVRVVDNEFRDGVLGFFAADRRGFAIGNTFTANLFAGLILCKVPAGSYQLPGGAIVGSLTSGADWFVLGNNAFQNVQVGYLVTDGANRNLLVNNRASNNGTYDIELTGATNRFGFCAPLAFNNKVIVGPHPTLTVNNWGVNNRVIGGVQSSTPVSPCP